ncbi:MAG TPA: hypothetical protein VFU26_15530 [Gaiellaceae bacterium]|nr:hypothetical protein [Gaiellaceae bacterium]
MARTVLVAVLALFLGAAVAAPASAHEVVLRDDEGRAMRFDVRADVDVDWYAGLLRRAAHGNEIERVTIRIVDWRELAGQCSTDAAAGCYSRRNGNRGLMVVPAGRSSGIAHTVVHEYGHHVDASRRHGGLVEPNGTPLWWKARGMAELVAVRSVRNRYQVGWDRAISEVFAEDYAYTNLRRSFKIGWLEPPTRVVQQAILADLGLAAPPTITDTRPAIKPVVITREGTLQPNGRITVDFGLLGPNRYVRLQGVLVGAGVTRGHVEVVCDARQRRRGLTGKTPTTAFGLTGVGPAACTASITNTGTQPGRYRLVVRLGLQRRPTA